MISYRTYRNCPNPPEGVNPDWVWQMSVGELPGWTTVTEQQYEDYTSAFQEEIQRWSDWAESREVMVSIRDRILSPAMVFGESLVKEFASENIAMGITQEGKTGAVRAVAEPILDAVMTGSLYDAMSAIRHIPVESYDAKYITAARMLVYLNKIESYMNLPLSTQL
jgi:hypothetical protein